ncbi:MAG: glycerol-3-phosphate acyltransferase [Caldilinea sp.]|nr:glycerol-3-phosphate acyltransferase [Caldilinea sp.]MCB0058548.1 glycerol-3-phosphate acyltransferase [Caldilineaceae bacterium]MCB9114180.1 glycerol-3-phosphate acyltransferase [Caldilineaceae bacterium]MCB9120806.1 glycerol-3-phosphate acyltransferase [Caldilineaceae bacterium]MCO5209742.1 glycerol-3-phosphate acyltransferase [Caldilinea sp.]
MMWLFALVAALIGYVLGSIPVGLWVCRMYGVDIRTVGSGRIGGTNAWRAAGLKAAVPTIIGDAVKGAVAVLLVRWLFFLLFPEPGAMSVEDAVTRTDALNLSLALAGGLAVIGHNWSFLNGFKGGAGGITTAATTLAISPLVGGITIIIGAFVIWWTRIASVGTFAVGVASFALFLILAVDQITPWPFAIFGVIALAAVMIALRPNREKLREQKERIITLW